MVDEQSIRDFLPQLGARVTEGMVILDPVQVCRYGGDRSRATTDPKRQHLVLADLRPGLTSGSWRAKAVRQIRVCGGDLDQAVVLGDPFPAGRCAGFDLPAAAADCEVGDEGVRGFA